VWTTSEISIFVEIIGVAFLYCLEASFDNQMKNLSVLWGRHKSEFGVWVPVTCHRRNKEVAVDHGREIGPFEPPADFSHRREKQLERCQPLLSVHHLDFWGRSDREAITAGRKYQRTHEMIETWLAFQYLLGFGDNIVPEWRQPRLPPAILTLINRHNET